jgi:hypothetical protein
MVRRILTGCLLVAFVVSSVGCSGDSSAGKAGSGAATAPPKVETGSGNAVTAPPPPPPPK